MIFIAAFVVVVFLYSLVSRRLERTMLTAPILFTVAGALTSFLPGAMGDFLLDKSRLLLIAELAACRTNAMQMV